MTYDPRKVVTYGFPLDDEAFTYAINDAGASAATLGMAVELDTSAPGTVKLATDGAFVFGRLISYEDRTAQNGGKTGTVQREFKELFPVKPAAAGLDLPVIGDTVVGAGGGYVRASHDGAAKTPNLSINVVVEVIVDGANTYVAVESL